MSHDPAWTDRQNPVPMRAVGGSLAVMPLVRPGLVDELQPKLQLTRLVLLAPQAEGRAGDRARDRSKVRPPETIVRNGEHNSVEEVECFGTEFKVPRFSESHVERSEQGQVEVLSPVRSQRV